MASVFVVPEHRKQGVGTTLVRQIMHTGSLLGFRTLYLITHDQQQLYKKLGWSAVEELDYRGESVTLMKYDQ